MTAVRHLARLGAREPELRGEILRACGEGGSDPRSAGARAALEDAWGGSPEGELPERERSAARRLRSWDEDPAVMLRKLRETEGEESGALLGLLRQVDARQVHEVWEELRAEAIARLLAREEDGSDEATVRALEEPRYPFLRAWVSRFLERLPRERGERLARRIQGAPGDFPEEARRWAETGAPPEERGPSYFSRRPAVPPLTWAPPPGPAAEVPRRRLGEGGPAVSALGLSGRYGLEARCYAEALEAGLNLLFWEPEYAALGQFIRALPAARRADLVLVSGTFEATPRVIRRDLERALRLLRVERMPVFLLFWARSPGRLSDDVLETLERLAHQGKLGRWGLSTHDRDLGCEAVERGAGAVMLRYNAAHRGAEERLLPAIQRRAAGALAFTCQCYGRLQEATREGPPPSPADCYRFALAHPAISACIMAPREGRELRENLPVLAAPELPPERLASLRRHGDEVLRRSRNFQRWIRSR